MEVGLYILVTYDVTSGDSTGFKRLGRVARICARYGQRVQYSVFECLVDPAQYEALKHELSRVIDSSRDSLRFYNLSKRWQNKIEHIGTKQPYDPEEALVI